MRSTGDMLFTLILVFGSFLSLFHEASSIDPGLDGYIINCYLENFKSAIRRQTGGSGRLELPDFDFYSDRFYGVSGRLGTFEDVANIYRVDDAKLVKYGDVTNMQATFYLPDAHLHYEITMFDVMKIDLDIRVLTNAVDVNFNYTKSANVCSVQYNSDSVYISRIEGSTVNIYIDILHRRFIPAAVTQNVELAYESVIELFVDTGLIFFIREGLSDYVLHLLVNSTSNMNLCDIFDGQAHCGILKSTHDDGIF